MLAKVLRWPAACLFPALDIARLLALNGAAAQDLASSSGALGSNSGLPHHLQQSYHSMLVLPHNNTPVNPLRVCRWCWRCSDSSFSSAAPDQ